MEIVKEKTENGIWYYVYDIYGIKIIASGFVQIFEDWVEITKIDVIQEERGKGIGTKILREMIVDFKDCEIIVRTYSHLEEWYKRHGFTVIKRENNLVLMNRRI